jgi:hypothetical protein
LTFAPSDVCAIPVQRLSPRQLRLGPFGSGRELVKFLGVASVGAAVAAVTSAAVWIPFLAVGALLAFVRVEGRTLDDLALGYCRFRVRTTTGARAGAPPVPSQPASDGLEKGSASIQAFGIPIAYLPPQELQRLYDEWRATLAGVDRPIGCRVRGERFSPLPFLPVPTAPTLAEREALSSYRQMVRLLLHHRYRRVIDLSVWNDPADAGPGASRVTAQLDALTSALHRLAIPANRAGSAPPRSAPPPGVPR